MKKPFYASQLADIAELILTMGLAPIVAEGVAQKLADSNGVLSDEAFDYEIEEKRDVIPA